MSIDAQAGAGTTFELKATNDSSLPGQNYFNVYPPILTNLDAKAQTLVALVSDATSKGQSTTMTWQGGNGALSLFAVTAGASPVTSPSTAVALGDTVVVDWAAGAFTITPAAGGLTGSIQVSFSAEVPPGTKLGLVVGPGSILVRPAMGQAVLTLTPDMSLVATVSFGTAFQLPPPPVSDVSQPMLVTFQPGTSSSGPLATAEISVGVTDEIVQLG
ncbi:MULTISPECIES: hypothetical protein [unclassified Rhizobium]|uniref:hypothetical protein n=1 Tax=unclassified Rhizobium TaxID=2613769 RepID=UPI001AD9A389|nr:MULTISPECIES: hypothetical protein [unclassified Rhizobium]MBO9100173.1 hypothetical protein [Rhizobium sp. L58/93]MBO9135670.1 hypothetical protein [Rhizobium sp. B209b/85]MBO9170139.1 hypothetical protein [Rhizobium sp. L245/93]MBO9186066.1 hypothetical protein [Rhizobium sp. E27B/91]QXZ82998.1 hypothetical protein J5287_13025 [Rhizobium sp. K1/93]